MYAFFEYVYLQTEVAHIPWCMHIYVHIYIYFCMYVVCMFRTYMYIYICRISIYARLLNSYNKNLVVSVAE